eukprot:g67566.t1
MDCSGTRIACAGQGHDVNVWDIEQDTGKPKHQEPRRFKGHTDQVTSVAFSHTDKNILASGSADKSVRIWLVDQGVCRPLPLEQGHSSTVNCLAFSHNGQLLASAGKDRNICIWNLEQRTLVKRLEGHHGSILRISLHGNRLASRDNRGAVKLWDLEALKELNNFEGKPSVVGAVAISPDGKYVASGGKDKVIIVWDTRGGQVSHVLQGHSEGITSLCFSPDGHQLASASLDETIRVWSIRVAKGKQQQESLPDQVDGTEEEEARCVVLQGHSDAVHSVAWVGPEHLISSSGDRTARFWTLHAPAWFRSYRMLGEHKMQAYLRSHRADKDATRVDYAAYLSHLQPKSTYACYLLATRLMLDHGVRVWHEVEPGTLSQVDRLDRIARSACFLCFASKGYPKDTQCLLEYRIAVALDKAIVWIRAGISAGQFKRLVHSLHPRGQQTKVDQSRVIEATHEYYTHFVEVTAEKIKTVIAGDQAKNEVTK